VNRELLADDDALQPRDRDVLRLGLLNRRPQDRDDEVRGVDQVCETMGDRAIRPRRCVKTRQPRGLADAPSWKGT
jgi:hypothetical protein